MTKERIVAMCCVVGIRVKKIVYMIKLTLGLHYYIRILVHNFGATKQW